MRREDETIETLNQIRSIVDKSPRLISLSGWSGVWAGVVALAGAYVAHGWLHRPGYEHIGTEIYASISHFDSFTANFIFLGIAVFALALGGVIYFTGRQAHKLGVKVWNDASRQMLVQLFYPVFAGSVFCFMFIYYGCGMFVAPTSLVFYGLALISAGRHSDSDIKYLGMLEVTLGCTALFFPGGGLLFWALGFGVLHILYGIMMRGKYEQ
ncbi:MAG: hypothetical protein KF744_00780 [Taibaiella sp.]|nr:hypothetical protein [Taibaiella sp.]